MKCVNCGKEFHVIGYHQQARRNCYDCSPATKDDNFSIIIKPDGMKLISDKCVEMSILPEELIKAALLNTITKDSKASGDVTYYQLRYDNLVQEMGMVLENHGLNVKQRIDAEKRRMYGHFKNQIKKFLKDNFGKLGEKLLDELTFPEEDYNAIDKRLKEKM
ncbi:MAG: hypothetical protein BV459_07975 [Thermoplasmata archaeon M11B2D]|nr:MAG: hypothetical protein BV459_07975 [Thermoplasmata archaeon M11B2D]